VSPTDGPAAQDFMRLITGVLDIMGSGVDYSPKLKRYCEAAGLVDIHERVFDLCLGANNTDKALAEAGALSKATAVEILAGHAAMLPKKTSFTQEEMDGLAPRWRKELLETGAHYPTRVVWGRKPS
jgi:hypothetical protein